jgi:hypothetical protein
MKLINLSAKERKKNNNSKSHSIMAIGLNRVQNIIIIVYEEEEW